MKNWITPLIVLAGLLVYWNSLRGDAASADARESFAEASAFYDQGEFEKAEASYLDLLDDGQKSSAVFYNLALTQEALKQSGKAILNLEKAAILDPGSREIKSKLTELRKDNGSALPESSFWQTIPVHWWTVGGALGVLLLALLPLSRLFKFPHGPSIATAITCLAIIGASAYFIHKHDQRSKNQAIILTADTPLRMSPFEEAESLQTLAAGQAVTSVEDQSHANYCLIETRDGKVGWVRFQDVANLTR